MIDDACGVITKPLFEESAKAVTARSISAASRKSRGFASTLSVEATAWITPNRATPEGVAASRRTATRLMPGAISLRSSSHFPLVPYSNEVKPVALPPGRARLATNPAPTGSATIANTIGMVRVTWSNGPTVEAPGDTMTSGARAANSVACLRTESALAVAQRVPTCTFRPMVQPDCPKLAGTPRTKPDIAHHPRLRAGAHRCAAPARLAEPAPRAATRPPRRRGG